MQYQVYKEDTGEVIAWIDTADTVQVVKDGYAIKCGENLKAKITNEVDECESEDK